MRAWLHERNVTLDERDFFQKPFSDAELRALLSLAHPEPVEGNERDSKAPFVVSKPALSEAEGSNHKFVTVEGRAALLFSWKSPSFKPALSKVEGAVGLSPDALDSEALIRLMLREPRLIRRPIVRIGDRIILGADWPALESALRQPSP